MPVIDEQTLKKQIKNKMFEKVYLLYGDEMFLKQHYANQLASKSVSADMRDFNFSRFEAGFLIDDLLSAAEQLPLMSEKRCVLICDFDAESAPGDTLAKLSELLADLPETTVLIFWCDTTAAKKTGKWKPIFSAIQTNGAVIEFSKLDTPALCKVLISSAAKRKCALSAAVARYLIETCGNDMQNLQTELDKLCSYKKESAIEKEDIDLLSPKTADATAFQLNRAITARNPDLAFKLLDDLYTLRTEPVMILSAMITGFIDIYRAKAAVSAGLRPEEIAKDFGYTKSGEFRLKKGAEQARLNIKTLRGCLDVLDRADRLLKSSSADARITLEETVIRLIELERND